MSYVAILLQACLHWRCAYFQTLSWNDTIFVVNWDILYKLCGSANKCSKAFVFSGKIWWQFFSCIKARSKCHTRSTTTPKYTLPQRLVEQYNNNNNNNTFLETPRPNVIQTASFCCFEKFRMKRYPNRPWLDYPLDLTKSTNHKIRKRKWT